MNRKITVRYFNEIGAPGSDRLAGLSFGPSVEIATFLSLVLLFGGLCFGSNDSVAVI